MNPARTINRGATRSISPASAASNASRPEKRRCSTTRIATPRAAAVSRPSAPGSLLMTVVIGSPASSSACMLLPRPEMSTATDMNRSVDPRRSVAVFLEQREHALVAIQVQRAERRLRYMDSAELMAGRDALFRHAPEQAAREALIRRRPGGDGRKQKARKKKAASIHDPGPIIASGRTQRSKSSALT